jgi:hypothetical protein
MPKSDNRKAELIRVVQRTKQLPIPAKAALYITISSLKGEQLDFVWQLFQDAMPAIEAGDWSAALDVLRQRGVTEAMIEQGQRFLRIHGYDLSSIDRPGIAGGADGIGQDIRGSLHGAQP